MRPSNRNPDQMRAVEFTRGFTKHAEGSVLISFGDTRVICNASVEDRVPRFLKGSGQGWVTAEYGMLPRSTGDRMGREAARGKQGGRTLEIQRLIGRSLRAVVDLRALGERTITLDCDVIQADGGTRTASITGGALAVKAAIARMAAESRLPALPGIQPLAAVSAGLVEGRVLLDLDYSEDSQADADGNFVMAGDRWVELQVTAETAPLSDAQFDTIKSFAAQGISELRSLWGRV